MSLVGFRAQNHPQQRTNPQVDDRATTPEDFARFNNGNWFTIDVAASAANAKCERFYSIEDNGLEQSWRGERVWCNPPYSNIRPWVEKAWAEILHGGCELVVMLVPANRTEQAWWQELVESHRDIKPAFRVEFLPGRMRFIRAGSTEVGPNERPPFGCCLLIWHRDPARAATQPEGKDSE